MLNVEIKSGQKGLGKQCELILRTLPQWFGREESLRDYVREIDSLETFGAWLGEELIGFISINQHFEKSAELHVLGVKASYHGQSVGTQIYQKVESHLMEKGIEYLQVKTLSPLAGNEDYAKTLRFYTKMGFFPLEDFTSLWGEDTPCRQMIKYIKNEK